MFQRGVYPAEVRVQEKWVLGVEEERGLETVYYDNCSRPSNDQLRLVLIIQRRLESARVVGIFQTHFNSLFQLVDHSTESYKRQYLHYDIKKTPKLNILFRTIQGVRINEYLLMFIKFTVNWSQHTLTIIISANHSALNLLEHLHISSQVKSNYETHITDH